MRSTFLAIAVFSPVESKEQECFDVTRALCDLLRAKGYARDSIYRDARDPNVYLDIREWTSTDAAIEAHNDLEVHEYWKKLDKVCRILKIYEHLDAI